MRQYFGSLVRQYGPEAQHLLIPRRGDFGIHADNAPELIPAHDEPRVVTAMAPVFEQQPPSVANGLRLHGPDAVRARYSSIFRPK